MRGLRSRARAEGARRTSGQSTLEYALVLLAFASTIAALGLMWRVSRSGRLVDGVREAASHDMGSGIDIGLLQDVTAF